MRPKSANYWLPKTVLSRSTKRTIKHSVSIFREYLCQNGIDPAFENLSTEGLDLLLRNFFVAVRTKDGKILRKSSLNCIKYGLTKYLKAEKDVDISADAEFQTSREVYRAILVDMKKKGYGGVEHFPPIAPDDLKKLFNDDLAFNISTPTGLQNKVWFEIVFYLCRRGRENLRAMTRDTFAVATDDTGRKYIYQKTDGADKNHTDDTVGESRVYEITGSNMCPVLSFEKYISKLNPNQEALWQRPVSTGNKATVGTFIDSDEVWYVGTPLGKNTLSGMMPKISSQANLSNKYSNHSIRATCITLLDKAGIEARHIMRTSGHRSEASIRYYSHRLSDNKNRQISETLSSAVGVVHIVHEPTPSPVSKVTGSSELDLPGSSTSGTPHNVVIGIKIGQMALW